MAATFFQAAINSGKFDGYALYVQSQGFWGGSQYQYITEIINYMIANNKLDPFWVSDNGLSAGGQASWEMLLNYPTYLASSLPMSSTSIGYKDAATVNKVKFTPMWLFPGRERRFSGSLHITAGKRRHAGCRRKFHI
jgi:hypothetical protein